MAKNVIETTEVEDAILVPYAASQGSTVGPDLFGQRQVERHPVGHPLLRLRGCSHELRGWRDPEAVCKDENAVFNAVWNDWNGQKKFAGVIAVGLASKPAVAAPASGMPV